VVPATRRRCLTPRGPTQSELLVHLIGVLQRTRIHQAQQIQRPTDVQVFPITLWSGVAAFGRMERACRGTDSRLRQSKRTVMRKSTQRTASSTQKSKVFAEAADNLTGRSWTIPFRLAIKLRNVLPVLHLRRKLGQKRARHVVFGDGEVCDQRPVVFQSSSVRASELGNCRQVFLDGSAELIASALISAPNTGAATALGISIQSRLVFQSSLSESSHVAEACGAKGVSQLVGFAAAIIFRYPL
jgi:hypothetical protein